LSRVKLSTGAASIWGIKQCERWNVRIMGAKRNADHGSDLDGLVVPPSNMSSSRPSRELDRNYSSNS
jgi:hypothetical protein